MQSQRVEERLLGMHAVAQQDLEALSMTQREVTEVQEQKRHAGSVLESSHAQRVGSETSDVVPCAVDEIGYATLRG